MYIISMDYRKKLKTTIAIFKSATSIIKATVSTKRNAKLQIAILRATAPNLSAPPSDESISAVLSAGRQTACACLQALMDRLHETHKASVALKCLFTIHSIVTATRSDDGGGSHFKIILEEYSSGGRNFLNLSRFRDRKAAELSCWVRWYASVVEKNLMVSRFLGHFLNPNWNSNSISGAANRKEEYHSKEYLLNEMDFLVDFVEVICSVPESLHLQRNDLVYEVVRRVGEDYRIVQREVFARVNELRAMSLSLTELAQFLNGLKRFEDCKRMVRLLFVNRARNDALWELVSETKTVIVEMMKEMGEIKLLVKIMGWEDGSNSSINLEQKKQLVWFGSGVSVNIPTISM